MPDARTFVLSAHLNPEIPKIQTMGNGALTPPPRLLVATLNLLGEGLNPFEFIPTNDTDFMSAYGELLESWRQLEWKHIVIFAKVLIENGSPQIAKAFEDLEDYCSAASSSDDSSDCSPRRVVSYFSEDVLNNDNKLLGSRLNLITFAMRPLCDDAADAVAGTVCANQQFSLIGPSNDESDDATTSPWFVELRTLVAASAKAKEESACRVDIGGHSRKVLFHASVIRFYFCA
jgi:hypothetical protein